MATRKPSAAANEAKHLVVVVFADPPLAEDRRTTIASLIFVLLALELDRVTIAALPASASTVRPPVSISAPSVGIATVIIHCPHIINVAKR
jgi:hypothetical protein